MGGQSGKMAETCFQSKGQNRLYFTLITCLPGYKPLLRKTKLVNCYLTNHHHFILLFLHLSPGTGEQMATYPNSIVMYQNSRSVYGPSDKETTRFIGKNYLWATLVFCCYQRGLRPPVSIKREVAVRWLQMSQCVLTSYVVAQGIDLKHQASPERDSWEQAPWVMGFTRIASPHTASPLMWISNHKATQEGEPQTIHTSWLNCKGM